MAKQMYACKCGMPTLSPGEICILCRSKNRQDKPALQKEDALANFKDKECECGVTFKPSAPRDKFCAACKIKAQEAKPKKATKTSTPLQARDKKPKGNGGITLPSIKRQRPGVEVEMSPAEVGQYHLTINFSEYPHLYERLIQEASEDFRPPEMEIMFLLKNTFDNMEEELKGAGADAS